jgi:hypothetical protein
MARPSTTPFSSAAGRTRLQHFGHECHEIVVGLGQGQLATDDSIDIEGVIEQLRLNPRVPFDRRRRMLTGGWVRKRPFENRRPAKHGVYRRSQLVGERRNEVVLDPSWP